MDIKEIFFVTQKVEVIEYDLEAKKQYIYHSRVEDIRDTTLCIAEPYFRGFFLPRKYNREYRVRVTTEQCTYVFTTRLVKYVEEPIPLWAIAMPTEVVREQRRDYVRLNVNLDVTLQNLDDSEEEEPISAITKDISGTGVSVLLKDAAGICKGKHVRVTMSLEDKVIQVEGIVLRVLLPEAEHEKPLAAIQFKDIDRKQKEWIIRYIFKKQLERRHKEEALFA